ncbi:hypothetical protein [Micromonospora sp. WMMD975]|uniref:hypothetical protein n=1 Tax=Micromonospora sp. WMMD975 TaxID=3016087 RepID=UPI00249C5CDC|nr:hypothetical protein [Micromonospora sp. WMMD975]WFE30988.1 hypothetical protein O7613_15160 [Micromonospora sp. WMMD975]
MTLIDEIRNPSSSSSTFLRHRLPGRERVVDRWAQELVLAAPVPAPVTLDPSDRPRLGAAFEMRVGFDLADEAPYPELLPMLPPGEVTRVLTAAGLQKVGVAPPATEEFGSWGRRAHWDPRGAGGQLHRDAWNLSEFAGLLRRTRQPDRQQWQGLYRIMQEQVWPHAFPAGVAEAMAALWHAYLDGGRQELVRLGIPRVTQPVFDDAFAVGDLVLGGCLVDIKVYADPAPGLQEFMDQLLGYVLSDSADSFTIRSVGLYLGWHAHLLTAELPEIIGCEPRYLAQSLIGLRSEFRTTIHHEVQRARFFKHGTLPEGGLGDAVML